MCPVRSPRRAVIGAAFGLAVALCAPHARALQPLSAFIDSASRHNLETRAQETVATLRGQETTMARARLGPTLSIEAGYTHNQFEVRPEIPLSNGTTYSVLIQPHNQFDATIGLTVPLVDALAWQRIRVAETNEAAARTRVQMTRREIEQAVVQGWYQVASAEAALEAARRAVEFAQADKELTLKRKEAGFSSEVDIARATAEIERARQVVADAELMRAIAARTLETLSGLAPETGSVAIEDDLHEEPPVDAFDNSVDTLPSVRAAQSDTRAAQQTVSAAWSGLIPTLSAFAVEKMTNATGFGFPAQFAFGIQLAWRGDLSAPWAIMSTYTQVSLAQTREQIARNAARDAIHNAWHRVHAAIARGQAARAQKVAADTALRMVRDAYANGAGSQIELMQTERDAFAAEIGRLRADAEVQMARALLHVLAGQGL